MITDQDGGRGKVSLAEGSLPPGAASPPRGGNSARLTEPVGSADGCVDSDCTGREQTDSGDDGKVHVAQDGTLDAGTAEDGCVHALA